jgi:hydrogenase maturation protein HypF
MTIRGAVQGVGFRPFVFRLATELGLTGWIQNSTQGVTVEVEGQGAAVQSFLLRLEREKPPRSFIQSQEATYLDPRGYTAFDILASEEVGAKTALVLPDIATCPECLQEVLDPANRRYGYPFTNCTHCGPRYSIIEALPYDRPNTSMRLFQMCERCRQEYQNPQDRRFHAQPNACPDCGPRLELWNPSGKAIASAAAALRETARALVEGAIVAVKGLGGFHLMVLAGDEAAIRRLRERKHREEKPLAVMVRDLDHAKELCAVSELEERVLRSPEAPIVLLRRRASAAGTLALVCPLVAPGNPWLGVMVPYTPLHHLLMAEVQVPLVATSGNLSEEPICTDQREALERLGGIADLFLVHDRGIVRHVDDSIVRVVMGRELVLRRARGFAPLPVALAQETEPTLALGAQLKNTVALALGHDVFVSQHIGELSTEPAFAAFKRVIADLQRLYGAPPKLVVADCHPDYISTKHAMAFGLRSMTVQHHYAHVLSCMAENQLVGSVLGVSWDGTGYGSDQTVWGGEFLKVSEASFERVGHWRKFPLPGGERAVQEPCRAALGLLYELFGEAAFGMDDLAPVQAFSPRQLRNLRKMLIQGLNCPMTSSAGRLFDAVASLAGLRQRCGFEGQAAMDLEFALEGDETDELYPVHLVVPSAAAIEQPGAGASSAPPEARPLIVDWGAMIREMLHDLRAGLVVWVVSAKFHNALAESIVAVARQVGELRVVLSGGCFQNKYLTERVVDRLRSEKFQPYWHQRVPPNDGGIALGQVYAAARAADNRTT